MGQPATIGDNVLPFQPRREKKRRRLDGLSKRCGCDAKRRSQCEHPWWGFFKPPGGRRRRENLQKRYNRPGALTRTEAEALLDRFRAEVRAEAGQPAGPGITFDALADLYATSPRSKADCTPRGKNYWVEHARTTFGAKRIDDITDASIEAFADSWQRRERARRGANGGRDARRKMLQSLRHLFNWAIKKKHTRRTPFKHEGVAVIDVPASRARDRRLVGDEEVALLEVADPYTKDLIVAALQTGCRGGELRSLQWADVTEDAILIRSAKAKTRRARAIAVNPTLRAMLDRRRNGPDGRPLPPDAHVFGDPFGGPMRKKRANDLWRATCKAAGIDDLHFHDLRHEVASRLLDRGAPMHDVRDALGHTTMAMTSRYAQTSAAGLRGTFALLDP